MLCRTPELEYASTVNLAGKKALDHCCGDGVFAELAWPNARFSAGCDLDSAAIERAKGAGRHERLAVCDAAQRLPYEDGEFDLVFDNSALEHIPDVDSALREIARVTRPGGEFAFNVLNERYFEWWPATAAPANDYRAWQPFIHAFSLAEWRRRLQSAGFEITRVSGYFDRRAAGMLALLDGEFSGAHLRQRASKIVDAHSKSALSRLLWRRRIGAVRWRTGPDDGAGFFIECLRKA